MRLPLLASASFLLLAACDGGGGGGGDEPAPEPNSPPELIAPPELGGGPVQFQYVLAAGSTASLTFSATDPDGDPLTWQLSVGAAAQTAAGLVFTSPSTSGTFTIDFAVVADPANATVLLQVQDPRGGAAAIDVQIVRSGAPQITAVEPSSAFASAPQAATIHGAALLLGGAVNTSVTFGGAAAGAVVAVDDETLTCTTPAPALVGPNSVGVTNAYGSDALPGSAFTMYGYPVDLFAADVGIDAGAGSQLSVTGEGATLHATYVEAGVLLHRRSLDFGATWSAAQALSSGETPAEAQVSTLGDEVVVAWIGNGTSVLARASVDGGVSFAAAVTLNPLAGGDPSSRPRLARTGSRVYCAWLQGAAGVTQQRVHATSSDNNGGVWLTSTAVSDQGSNHEGHALGCDENAAWVAFESAPGTGAGVYTARTTTSNLWTSGVLRSAVSAGIGEVAVCDEGGRVNLVWTRDGNLEYLVSQNSGLGWQTLPTLFRSAVDLGAITDVTVRCEDGRLFAAYVAGADEVAFSRVGAPGALPEHVTLSDTTESASRPDLAVSGNYLFAAWRGGDVGGGVGPARIQLATSVDLGLAFTAPATFGDGAAAQDLPRLLVDGARVWLGWLDYRGAGAALFSNRTEQ